MSVTIAVPARIISRLFIGCTIAELLHGVVLTAVCLVSVSALDIGVSRLASLGAIWLQSDISDVMHACELQVFRLRICCRRRTVKLSFHLSVGSLAELLSSNPDVDNYVGDTRGGPDYDESKEGLVDVADPYAGVISPVGDTTGMKESPGHIPAQKAHAHYP
jgi:hypothetical protein